MSDVPMSDDHVYEARAVALFPPRPEAIMTLLHSPNLLGGTQTLLYSLKKTLSLQQRYPPEIVVLVTPNVSPEVYNYLCPTLCTRILPISEWIPSSKSVNHNKVTTYSFPRTLDNHCPGWTKLKLFGLQQYETILYIDSDCLVLKDVSPLLELNKLYTESEALIAAAPDLLPPHHFNSGVMVVRPSTKVMESMEQQATTLNLSDISDTGFLNAFFPNWYTEFPPFARLPVGYNAQEAMFDMTMDSDEKSIFWDLQVGVDLYIVHYSNNKKPWHEKSEHALHSLWNSWYRKSKNFLQRMKKEEQGQLEMAARQQRGQPQQEGDRLQMHASQRTSGSNNPLQTHRLIAQRYTKLRGEGKSTSEAMLEARAAFGQGHEDETDPGVGVAAMLGIM